MIALTLDARHALGSAKEKAVEQGKPAKVRVQLDFAPKSMERLNALRERTEAASYAEVVKNALKLYEGLIDEVESGKQFFVRDENGVMAPFKLFL